MTALVAVLGEPLSIVIGVVLVFYGVRLIAEGLVYLSEQRFHPAIALGHVVAGLIMFPIGFPPLLRAMGLV
ncbi:MAG: hypothetical protein J7M26_09385 [Armatimonadetes bacterium]|nr:hypothetical protein [Armatimonadota bacterium]